MLVRGGDDFSVDFRTGGEVSATSRSPVRRNLFSRVRSRSEPVSWRSVILSGVEDSRILDIQSVSTSIDMTIERNMFRGTFTALVTPFRDGDIDVAALEKLIEAQIAAGITGIVAVGTTGESPTLIRRRTGTSDPSSGRRSERPLRRAGRHRFVFHTRRHRRHNGRGTRRDAALLVAPYYNKPSQEGLFRHFKAIADSTSLPIMLYNIPGRCGVDIRRTPWCVWPRRAATSSRSRKQAAAWSESVNCARVCPIGLRS